MPSTLWLFVQLFQLYLFILMMRFALHFARADFYNPLVQGIIKATDWLVAPLQKVLRPGRHFDPATLVAALLFSAITSAVLSKVMPVSLGNIAALLCAGVLGTFYTLLRMYMLAIIALAIMSWIAPQPTHPAPLLIAQITRPILAPLQRIIPPLGGMIDISPLIAIFGIKILQIVIAPAASTFIPELIHHEIPELIHHELTIVGLR